MKYEGSTVPLQDAKHIVVCALENRAPVAFAPTLLEVADEVKVGERSFRVLHTLTSFKDWESIIEQVPSLKQIAIVKEQ